MTNDTDQAVETVEVRGGEVQKPIANDDRPEENHIAEARKKQRKAERETEDLRKRLDEREDQDRSELEKVQKRAEEAEARVQELDSKTKKFERGSWVRSAAEGANFKDPDDAVVHANLSEIEDERDAQRFVKDLAARKKHLVKEEEGPPQIGQVLNKGQRVEGNGQQNAAQEAELATAQSFAAELKKLSSDWVE